MTGEESVPPRYTPKSVERAVLETVIELHPRCLPVGAFCQKIVADPNDRREVEVACQAIRDLNESGLVSYADHDGLVGLTPAALKMFTLLLT